MLFFTENYQDCISAFVKYNYDITFGCPSSRNFTRLVLLDFKITDDYHKKSSIIKGYERKAVGC